MGSVALRAANPPGFRDAGWLVMVDFEIGTIAGGRMGSASESDAAVGGAISRGVAYLWRTQATAASEHRSPRATFAGDWDQRVGFDLGPLRVPRRDTNPFIASVVVHCLQHVSEPNRPLLSLASQDCDRAREISRRVLSLVQRFESAEGTVGYWPMADGAPSGISQRLQARFFRSYYGGPALHGTLAPRGVGGFPVEFRIWPDPDCTAMASVARSLRGDGSASGSQDLRAILAPYAYSGQESLFFPSRSVPPVGAYFGFCVPTDRPDIPRDVDLIVNCNILYALALAGDGGTPEANTIVDWIVETTKTKAHQDISAVTLYYRWENIFHYAVARCYRDGGLEALAPAVETLADEARATALHRSDDTVFWDGHTPVRATSYALLCLLAAGEHSSLTDGAARYLLAQQCPRTGRWKDRWAPLGETMTERVFHLRCDAFATAVAIEALCRHQLNVNGPRTPTSR
jgi:hypothetical protein